MATTETIEKVLLANNDDEGQNKIREARREINERQNNSKASLYNVLLGIAGLFNVTLGFSSLMFSGVTTSIDAYWEELEDFYTKIYEDMTTPSLRIMKVTITHPFEGKWNTVKKEYEYSASMPTAAYQLRP